MQQQYSRRALISAFFVSILSLKVNSSPLNSSPLPLSCPTLSNISNGSVTTEIHQAQLKWIPDGDTLHTSSGKKLRLLHIDTPEINANNEQPTEALALAAKQRLAELVGTSGKFFWIGDEKAKDKYRRHLALLFNQQGILINAQLLAEGLAEILVIPPNQAFWRCMHDSESLARQRGLGIWSQPGYTPKKIVTLQANQRFQLIEGKITKIKDTSKNLWLILEDKLWVGIPKKHFHYFDASQLTFKTGETVTLRGYVYQSKNHLGMKLNHPAMILPQSPTTD